MSKGLVFSSPTPNDQGGIISNECIDFSRFEKNPLLLEEHHWIVDYILGTVDNWRIENGEWVCDPLFHLETERSKERSGMYKKGALRACSIGGEAVWKMNVTGTEYERSPEGYRICEMFDVYEISLVALPSNPDAVQKFGAKIYEGEELERVKQTLITLSSKFKRKSMETTTEDVVLTAEEKQAIVAQRKAASDAKAKEDAEATRLSTELQTKIEAAHNSGKKTGIGWLDNILGLGGRGSNITINVGGQTTPAPVSFENEPDTKEPGKILEPAQPGPIGLKASEKAKAEYEKAKDKAEECMEKAKKAKEDADGEDATDEMKSAAKKSLEAADEAMKACETAKAAYEKVQKKEDDGEEGEPDKNTNAATGGKNRTTNNSRPMKKSFEDLQAEHVKLAVDPITRHQARVKANYTGKPFTRLMASKDSEDERIIARALCSDVAGKEISSYRTVVESIMSDAKLNAIASKVNFHMNVGQGQVTNWMNSQNRNNPNERRGGTSLQQLGAQLDRGYINAWGRDNVMRQMTTLGTSDALLASPDLQAIEWLSMFIFLLYASSAWKTFVPTLPADITGRNLGVVWANSNTIPTIYRGTQPTNPTVLAPNDTPVAASMTPFFMQPMQWTPWTEHMLRYDQMSTGTAAGFAEMNQYIDDNLLYYASQNVPSSSIITSSGLSGYQTTAQALTIAPGTPNSFYYNETFNGSVKAPTLNDIIGVEQLYRNQNFDLENIRSVMVIDPIMEAALARDPETKSLLTRFVADNGKELMGYKHTVFETRSRVAIYDPVSGQMKDPYGTIPSTALSCGLGFIPNQIAILLGLLDVFMVQSPQNYGYIISADVREGLAALRANFAGLSAYTYANNNV